MQAISINLQHWLAQHWPAVDANNAQIEPLAMRNHVSPTIRYFRITVGGVTQLVVDMSGSELNEAAPQAAPQTEKRAWKQTSIEAPASHHGAVNRFADVLKLQADAGLNVPKIIAKDDAQGFLLLNDIAGETYLQALTNGVDPASLLGAAADALICWQRWQPNVATNAC